MRRAALLVLAACGGGPIAPDARDDDAVAADAPPALPLPSPLWGVTIDDVTELPAITTALAALPRRPVARVVFDAGSDPPDYAPAIAAIRPHAYVLGELLDSESVAAMSVAAYAERTRAYLAALPAVDLWEVGNEINGNWLGATDAVVAKMTAAYDLVTAAGGHTELTLYGCSDSGPAHDMLTWVGANLPARMRTGLDYVLVSYYDGDCSAPRTDWAAAFAELRAVFPTAGLGFGEIGHVDVHGNDLAGADLPGATALLHRYYGMTPPVDGYVGGYFWWYFAEDMVPMTRPLHAELAAAMQ